MKRTLLISLSILLLTTATAFAQERKEQFAIPSLEIGIGTTLDHAHSVLARMGAGGGRDTREGGRKEAWTLKETDFATLAFKTNGRGRIVWLSVFARPGKEVAFAKLGDLTKATTLTKSQVIWNVGSAQGGYRLVAKGTEGKASVVYLLSLDFPEIQ